MKKLFKKLDLPTQDEVKKISPELKVHYHEENLVIYCYSRLAVLKGYSESDKIWTNTLRHTRGVGFNQHHERVCVGIPKIFNVNENEIAKWKNEYDEMRIVLLQKHNGYMCIIWWDENNQRWRFTTKAAASHDYEVWGQLLYDNGKLHGFPSVLDKQKIYVAEGIDPINDPHTILAKEGLYLLVTIDKNNWTMEVDLDNYPGEKHDNATFAQAIMLQSKAQHEGYVAYICKDDGEIVEMLKLKTPYYLERRAALKEQGTRANRIKVYQNFRIEDGSVYYDNSGAIVLLEERYDDWWANKRKVIERLQEEIRRLYTMVLDVIEKHKTRKEVALALWNVEKSTISLAMAILENRSVETIINDVWVPRLLEKVHKEEGKDGKY